jgi:adenine-specific DNA-methyltransferase
MSYKLEGMGLDYDYPKPEKLLCYLIKVGAPGNSWVMDFFAGSGSTCTSVIKLNRSEEENRKYLAVEMNEYFDSVLKPHIQKEVLSSDWQDNSPKKSDGITHAFKYHELESYEDSLNNIQFKNLEETQLSLVTKDDEYFFNYMLDFETSDSQVFLNQTVFKNPFDFKLKIYSDDGHKDSPVDLVETFNYLIGLWVNKFDWLSKKEYQEIDRDYLVVRGNIDDDSVCVIWRNLSDDELKGDGSFFGEERDFLKNNVLTGNEDLVYINGDFVLDGAKAIEPEFRKRMMESVT